MDYTHYIAIDFGTAGSGFAYATNTNPDKLHVFNEWPGLNKEGYKTPTVLLIDPHGDFEAFGQEALNKYYNQKSLSFPDRFHDYYFFRNFKMMLYDNQENFGDLQIKAMNGKCLPAITVFSFAISYMKSKIIQWTSDYINFKFPNKKILWIITVPAIWSHGAKQVMRQAVDKVHREQSALTSDETTILALEPEAAAMHCIHDMLQPEQSLSYIIVDCGGGTIDVVAHEVTVSKDKDISIEEILPPHGSSCGGFGVNREFEELLRILSNLSLDNLKEVKLNYPKQWDKIIYTSFESGKIYTNPVKQYETTVEIKGRVRSYFEEKSGKKMDVLVEDCKDFKLEWDDDNDELVLPYRVMSSLFQPIISRIHEVIKMVLDKCRNINNIILVGGFAANSLLLQEIKSLFPTRSVTSVNDPHLAVLKGAVRYGINRKLIKSRKMPQTIGLETCVVFNSSIHKEKKRIQIDGQNYCKVFLPCVEINKSVAHDEKFEQIFKPLTTGSTCSITLYGSQSRSVVYVTSEEYPVAHIVIDKVDSLPSQDRRIMVTIKFGGTEVQVSACSAVNNYIKLPVRFADGNTSEESFVQSFKLDIRSF